MRRVLRKMEDVMVYAIGNVPEFYSPIFFQVRMLEILEDRLRTIIKSKKQKPGAKPGPRPERRKKKRS